VTNAWLYVHLAGVFGFLVAHGTSGAIGLRLRKERDPLRARALLDLSASALGLANWSLLVLLVGGIGAAVKEHAFHQGWPWAAIGVLVALSLMVPLLVVPYYKEVRRVVGAVRPRRGRPAPEPTAPAPPEEIARVLDSPIPVYMAWIGVAALAVLLWLMVYKPF